MQQRAEPQPTPPPAPSGVVGLDRDSLVRVAYGPDSETTRSAIESTCGFSIDSGGDRVAAVAVEPLGSPSKAFRAWTYIDQERAILTSREWATAAIRQADLTPASSSWIPRLVDDPLAHVVAHPAGLAVVVVDPDSIKGVATPEIDLFGAAVTWTDVAAIEIDCPGANGVLQQDELAPYRTRGAGTAPKAACVLTLRGGGTAGVAAFAVSIELDYRLSRSTVRKAQRLEVWAICNHIRNGWARAHLDRADLTAEQRRRVEAHLGGAWDHVVITDPDDGEQYEWLVAGLQAAVNGTLGVPAADTTEPSRRHGKLALARAPAPPDGDARS